jgi:hypothetical protein
LDLITAESCLPPELVNQMAAGLAGGDGQSLTPASAAELTTTLANHYRRKLCSTPS